MGEVDVVWMGTNLVDRFLEDTDDYVHSIGRFLLEVSMEDTLDYFYLMHWKCSCRWALGHFQESLRVVWFSIPLCYGVL